MGFVGAFECHGEFIGTIRLIPLALGLAPCDAILGQQAALAPQFHEAAWEVGRLVLAPQYRAGPEALKRCLFLTLLYLVRTTEITNIFASCTPLLSRLYRRFGFSVLMKDVCREGDDSFCLIHGATPSVLRALAGTEAEKMLAERELALI
ncbi:MAG: N-acyl amino acid synthase FeeM domain-containing protein [Ramlibacter sp.]